MKRILVIALAVLAFLGGSIGGSLLAKGPSRPAGTSPSPASAEAQPDGHAAPPDGADAKVAGEGTHGAVAPGGHGSGGSVDGPAEAGDAGLDWFHFPEQFFVPILRNGTTTAVMVLSLTLEMPQIVRPVVEAREHRLRDALLNALLIHANTGGFDGNFTSEASLSRLRGALLAAARSAGDPRIANVLIEDIARQEQ
jgi:hypothetical protein